MGRPRANRVSGTTATYLANVFLSPVLIAQLTLNLWHHEAFTAGITEGRI
jgi:hypothetical protein